MTRYVTYKNEEFQKKHGGPDFWFKHVNDTAFPSILEGYPEYEKVYLDLCKERRVVIQAGGYAGIFPRMLSEHFDMVYTFEPDPDNFHCLSMNCQKPNIVKMQAALGENAGMVQVNRNHSTNLGMHTVSAIDNPGYPILRLDDFYFPACDLIALDVEGFERYILDGSLLLINQFKPVISVEDTNEHIEKFLASVGYSEKAKVYRDTIYAVG